MNTLLLRLAGPMQAWGTQDRFGVRATGHEPSKSGVVGLVCAALGRQRVRDVGDLASLRMGVRVDFEGALRQDFHTAGGTSRRGERYGVAKADGKVGYDPVVSRRYFLADADFLVGLEGDESLLIRIEEALKQPTWPLCLGRKAFVPSVPVHLPFEGGLRPGQGLREALAEEPWPRAGLAPPREAKRPEKLRWIEEVPPGLGSEIRLDQPLGAAYVTRTFGPRHVRTDFLEYRVRSEADVLVLLDT